MLLQQNLISGLIDMRKIILLSIVSIFSSIVVFAQISDKRERIYLHTNNSTLISGETLVFGAYVLSELTGKPSHVSNQIYVELINEKESVYKTKIEITQGVGSGKIFIPSMFSTGRYYLIAYTRWMKNFDDRFMLPIDVYNPFESLKNDSITTNKPFISFYTSSGKIVAEKMNTIGFEIKHEGTPKREFKGRIQNTAGETVAEIIPDKNNMGSIELKPSLEKYQVILEEKGGAGGFFFFDFPSITPNGLTLHVNEKTDAFLIELNSSGRTDEGSICVSNTSGNYLKKQVILTGTTLIPKDELLTGLSEVTVLDNKQDTLARKMIYIPETFIFNTVQVSGEHKTRSKMEAKTLLPAGNYSISIRKKFENLVSPTIPSPFSRLNASPFYLTITQNNSDNKEIETFLMNPKAILNFHYRDQVDYLPESGRELLSGSIYGNDNSPISNEIVTMTIPGPEFQLQTAKTNEKGQFTFLYDSPDSDTKVYIGTQSARENINFNIENKWLNNLPKLEYPKLNADSIQILEIVERSIQIQLLNAFEETNTDSIWYSPIEEFAPYSFFFNLDEYNRFPTLKDHFIEYIPTVGIRKDR
ncbi:MAG: hypothetical protein OEW75_17635, partial [Cyclobacteriaceae bacterium]|nr:hypothetical protein [Cyclobacteriaceae bacterium]